MDFGRNSLLFLVIVLHFSCSSVRKSGSNGEAVLLLGSVLDSDTCSLAIDGKQYIDQRVIVTDRSLSIDLNTLVKFDLNPTGPRKLEVSFSGNRISGDPSLPPLVREVKLDTIIDLKLGHYFLIRAHDFKIELIQSKKKFRLD